MSEIYEDEGKYVTDCGLCLKQIDVETEEYYKFGIFYKHPSIFEDNEINKCYHSSCFKHISEGLSEEVGKLIDSIEAEGVVLGLQGGGDN